MKLDEGTTIHEQYTITVEVERDPFMGPPEKEHDGHGPVEMHRYDEHGTQIEPGMRVLARDRHGAALYNFDEAVKIALRDGWGSEGDEGLTGRAKAERAAEADYRYIRGWYRDEWHWLVGTVTLERPDGEGGAVLTLIDGYAVGGFDTLEAVLEWAAEEVTAAIEEDRKDQHEKQAVANRMHETIADIAYAAGARGWYSGDSRADMASIIAWAEEFERGRQEDDDGNEFYAHPEVHYSLARPEYMTAVDEFADAKLEEAAAPRPSLDDRRDAFTVKDEDRELDQGALATVKRVSGRAQRAERGPSVLAMARELRDFIDGISILTGPAAEAFTAQQTDILARAKRVIG